MQSSSRLASRQNDIFDQPGLSYGLFHLAGAAPKSFGIITIGLKMQGVNMDIGHLNHIRWARNHKKDDWVSYNRLRGQFASMMESTIPDAMFHGGSQCDFPNSTNPAPNLPVCREGISAVKAIALAAAEGQKIYAITQANWSTVRPQLQHRAGVVDEIDAAIRAGKEVQVHEKAINANGWTGSGYTVVDPETGAGAYIIEGAGNGAYAMIMGVVTGSLLLASLEALFKLPPALWAGPLIAIVGVILISLVMIGQDPFIRGCFFWGLALAFNSAFAAFLPKSPIISSNAIQYIAYALGVSATIFDVTSANSLQTCIKGPPS